MPSKKKSVPVVPVSPEEESPLVNGRAESPPVEVKSKKRKAEPEEVSEPVKRKQGRRKPEGLAAGTIPEDAEAVDIPFDDQPATSVSVLRAKRARWPSRARQEEEREAKRQTKLPFRHSRGWGQLLTVGQGDTGQLGLGEDVMEKSRPAAVTELSAAVDAVAGGMHTVVLDKDGEVWTFGCNDDGSLGRVVEEEEECFLPGKVTLPEKMVMLSAGDSHTATLSESGQVYVWGTFRDSSGQIGLVEPMKVEKAPVKVLEEVHVRKIVSGSDHLAMLSSDGQLWTMGNSEQGQLGRVNEKFAHRGGRRGLAALLKPDQVRLNFRSKLGDFTDVWAGSYNTVAQTEGNKVVVMGLNNYSQMALPVSKGLSFFMPQHSKKLTALSWKQVAIGQHHSINLESSGKVFALGRSEYGRLGLGEDSEEEAVVPTQVTSLESPAVEVACGTAVSYAVTEEGHCYSWGMGTNGQLGTGDEEDVYQPTKMDGKQLKGMKVVAVSSGGQHTVLIAKR